MWRYHCRRWQGGGDGSRAATASESAGGAHAEPPGAERGDECTGRADPGDARGYVADVGNPVPCGLPYSGTPTGDARWGYELALFEHFSLVFALRCTKDVF